MLEEKEAALKERIAVQHSTRRLPAGGGGPSRGDDWVASVDDQFLDNRYALSFSCTHTHHSHTHFLTPIRFDIYSFPSEDPAFIGAMSAYDAMRVTETRECQAHEGCVLGISSAMHTELSMETRLCSLCESCSGVIRENQVNRHRSGRPVQRAGVHSL